MSAPGFPWVAERAAFGQPSLNSLTLPPSLTPLVLKQDTMFFVVFLKQLISFVVVVQSLWPQGLRHSRCHPLSFTVSQSLLTFMPIESMMPSNHLILCCPRLLLPSVFPSIRVSYWPCLAACGILVPWPGMEPMPFAVEACWTTEKSQDV